MGTIKSGILGGFKGKVGSVVGTSWKGVSVIKAMPVSVSNPKTAKQVEQRNAMKAINAYLKSFGVENVRTLNNPAAKGISGWNRCVKKVVKFKPGNELSGHIKCLASGSLSQLTVDSSVVKSFKQHDYTIVISGQHLSDLNSTTVGDKVCVMVQQSNGLAVSKPVIATISDVDITLTDETIRWDDEMLVGFVHMSKDLKETSEVAVIPAV